MYHDEVMYGGIDQRPRVSEERTGFFITNQEIAEPVYSTQCLGNDEGFWIKEITVLRKRGASWKNLGTNCGQPYIPSP
jgi:hypothetical protein